VVAEVGNYGVETRRYGCELVPIYDCHGVEVGAMPLVDYENHVIPISELDVVLSGSETSESGCCVCGKGCESATECKSNLTLGNIFIRPVDSKGSEGWIRIDGVKAGTIQCGGVK